MALSKHKTPVRADIVRRSINCAAVTKSVFRNDVSPFDSLIFSASSAFFRKPSISPPLLNNQKAMKNKRVSNMLIFFNIRDWR